MNRYTVLCVLGAVATVPAFASDTDVGGTYLTPMIGVLRTDEDRPTNGRDYTLGGLALGKHFSEAWSAEVMLNGVPDTQITAKGYGEGQPIADNNTDAGRAKNRRVVMFVIDNPGDGAGKGAGETK